VKSGGYPPNGNRRNAGRPLSVVHPASERARGVCSSFYEGPAGADDPVAPGPTNKPNAGEKGLLCQRPAMAPGGLGRRGIGRRRGRGPRLTAPSPSPAPAGPAGTGTIPGTAVAVLVLVVASAVGWVRSRAGGRRERGRRNKAAQGVDRLVGTSRRLLALFPVDDGLNFLDDRGGQILAFFPRNERIGDQNFGIIAGLTARRSAKGNRDSGTTSDHPG
jgi:hypothetical protein